MKRPVIDVNKVGHGLADACTIEQRRKRYKLLKELGLLVPYDSKSTFVSKGNIDSRFSKYYETEDDYIKDKAKANILIYSDKNIPKDLYEKLAYTQKEIG